MGLSQADAASKYHVLQQNWARYETGTRVPHTFLCNLSELIPVSLEWLLTGKVSTRLAEKISHERQRQYTNTRDAAAAIGIEEKLLQAIEAAEIAPSDQIISRIAAHLGINKYQLLDENQRYLPVSKSTGDIWLDNAIAKYQEILELLDKNPEEMPQVLDYLRGIEAVKKMKSHIKRESPNGKK